MDGELPEVLPIDNGEEFELRASDLELVGMTSGRLNLEEDVEEVEEVDRVFEPALTAQEVAEDNGQRDTREW